MDTPRPGLGGHDTAGGDAIDDDLDLLLYDEHFREPRRLGGDGAGDSGVSFPDDDDRGADGFEPAFEQSSLAVPIPPTNKGFQLLVKMGWSAGRGLGVAEDGPVEPVPVTSKDDTLGLGKAEQMRLFHAASTAMRRTTEAEKIAGETAEQRAEREARVQRADAVRDEIKTVQAAFYCELCVKQYARIGEYDAHLSSYDHHHRKRFKEMQEASKRGMLLGQRKADSQAKDRMREERELQRMQAAMQARAQQAAPSASEPAADTDAPAPEATKPKAPMAFAFGAKKAVGGGMRFSLKKK
ncbi:hypothetical protein HK105_202944 [Polyrhizophydium stewartii]|uniref:G-patch domain-containing protein n=1 Tax=Polyrhizophydium stewartii TaxID=2732419 RepID=A0ABR4NDQ2_9FUNG